MNQLEVYPASFWAHRSAAHIINHLDRRFQADPGASLAVGLAGGTTPASVYRYWTLQTPDTFDWSRLHLFLSDERMVPLDHAESNFRMACELLPKAVHLYPVNTALSAADAAADYERQILEIVPADPPTSVPRFELVLLGMGNDGHTASLFPKSPVLDERRRLVSPAVHPETGQERVTFTLPLLHAASRVVFLVSGAAKAPMLSRALSGDGHSMLPAALAARGSLEAVWLVDQAAHGDAASR